LIGKKTSNVVTTIKPGIHMIWCASSKRDISIEWIWSKTLIGVDCIGADLHINEFSLFHPNVMISGAAFCVRFIKLFGQSC
jgi:hypothetical protein